MIDVNENDCMNDAMNVFEEEEEEEEERMMIH